MYIACWEWGAYLGTEALEQGVDVCVSSWARLAPNTLPSMAKAGRKLHEFAADPHGGDGQRLCRGHRARHRTATSAKARAKTFSWCRMAIVSTPPLASSVLPGITRSSIIALCEDLGITVREQMIPREMLYIADEVFFTGTAAEITPLRSIDRIQSAREARPSYAAAAGGVFRHSKGRKTRPA